MGSTYLQSIWLYTVITYTMPVLINKLFKKDFDVCALQLKPLGVFVGTTCPRIAVFSYSIIRMHVLFVFYLCKHQCKTMLLHG